MNSSYAPPGESAADLWSERSNFSGLVLGAVAYGVHLTVFSICARYLWHNFRHSKRERNNVLQLQLFAFVFILFAIGTIQLGANVKFCEQMWIDDRNVPGGPVNWPFLEYNDTVNVMGNGAYIAGNFLADGLLLWRTYIIWNNVYVMALPCLIYAGSTAMSILTIFQTTRPNASLWTANTISFSIPYFSLAISLNLILTMLIVGRLLYLSRSVRSVLGEAHSATYTSVASMMIESAAPYSIVSIIFIVTYARNSNVQNLVLPVLSQVMCISPEMIVLRVARGQAWSTTTLKTIGGGTQGTGTLGPMTFRKPTKVATETTSFVLSDFTGNQETVAKSVGTSTVIGSRYNLVKEDSRGEVV